MSIYNKYESAPPASEGWIEWGGGECPVESSALVDLKFRNGVVEIGHNASAYYWENANLTYDIIAYRPHKPDINSRANDDRLEQDLNECIGQAGEPKAWFPAVGEICQARIGGEWVDVKVAYIGDEGSWNEALVFDVKSTKPAWADEFRPLRTEAEKTREAAEKLAVADIIHELKMDENSHRDVIIAQKLYRAVCEGKIRGVNAGDK